MLKQLYSLEKNQFGNRTGPEENAELGRGQRKKYRKILSDSESSEEYEPVNKQVTAKNINRMRARSILQQYNQEKELVMEAGTPTRNDLHNELNEQILAELREIKKVLMETLTLLKKGCPPLLTPPQHPSDFLPPVVHAPSSTAQPLHVTETRSDDSCKKGIVFK
ncbi:hypothetical protein ROHU_032014 [Labeo rohita]|uniref:Uncharacterized protein n=1 Tax=Labeo rohita TaxID=84645 RepID=A0A498LJW9_LABRO|nr:hypothetical protein ROHU_032014 [Labeo rohita]